MFLSWRIGRPFGINLFVHWTFWLLPLWVLLTFHPDASPLSLPLQLGLIFALFSCVVLHELGHALTARRFGIQTHRIVLTPIGGMAQFDQPIRGPWPEFCIALAGPLVNLALAAGFAAVLFAGSLIVPGLTEATSGVFVFLLLLMNLVMAVFNLLPAFPMDGGRVLRALLAGVVGPLRATRAAVLVGTFVALAAGVAGLLWLHSPWALVIAAFVIWTGHAELAALEAEERRRAAYQEEEIIPTVIPVRSTAGWPSALQPVTVYIWDAQHARWVPETKG